MKSEGRAECDGLYPALAQSCPQSYAARGRQESKLSGRVTVGLEQTFLEQGGGYTDGGVPTHVGVAVGIHVYDAILPGGRLRGNEGRGKHGAMTAGLEHGYPPNPIALLT
jgi:hypothetical protein